MQIHSHKIFTNSLNLVTASKNPYIVSLTINTTSIDSIEETRLAPFLVGRLWGILLLSKIPENDSLTSLEAMYSIKLDNNNLVLCMKKSLL